MFETRRMVRITDSIERFADQSAGPGSDNRQYLDQCKLLIRLAIQYQLTEKQRQAVALYYYDQYNIYEIAQQLGIAPSSVCRRLQGARRRIEEFVTICLKGGLRPIRHFRE